MVLSVTISKGMNDTGGLYQLAVVDMGHTDRSSAQIKIKEKGIDHLNELPRVKLTSCCH